MGAPDGEGDAAAAVAKDAKVNDMVVGVNESQDAGTRTGDYISMWKPGSSRRVTVENS